MSAGATGFHRKHNDNLVLWVTQHGLEARAVSKSKSQHSENFCARQHLRYHNKR